MVAHKKRKRGCPPTPPRKWSQYQFCYDLYHLFTFIHVICKSWSFLLISNGCCILQTQCFSSFLGGLSLHLNHLIAWHTGISFWQFGTLPIGIFLSNLDSRHLMTSPKNLLRQFWHMSIFGDSRSVWVICQKKMPSENQFFLDEGVMGHQSVLGFVGG